MAKVKLKPCPFCGATPQREKVMRFGQMYWSIACENEKCRIQPMTDMHKTLSVITREWNRRAEVEE